MADKVGKQMNSDKAAFQQARFVVTKNTFLALTFETDTEVKRNGLKSSTHQAMILIA